jgi:alpha-N-arabinofuranosidase
LTHRHLPENPFQALGHGDFVETPDGWWVVFLGFRPQGGRFHHLGRETFLAPVTWSEDGWPVINGGKPIPATLPAPKLPSHPWPQESARDEFDGKTPRFCWNYVRNPNMGDYSLENRPGWLRLHGSAVTLNDVDTQTFLGRRQMDLACSASTKISFDPKQTNEEAGLVLRGNEKNHCEIVVGWRKGKRRVFLRKVLDGNVSEAGADEEAPPDDLVLTVRAMPLSYEFLYSAAGEKPRSLGTARTRDLSQETLTAQKGASFNFTGVVIGMFATGNGKRNTVPADFDWFEYNPENK